MDEIEEAVAWLRKAVENSTTRELNYVDYMPVRHAANLLVLIDMEIE